MVARKEYQNMFCAHQASTPCRYLCVVMDWMRARFDSNGGAVGPPRRS